MGNKKGHVRGALEAEVMSEAEVSRVIEQLLRVIEVQSGVIESLAAAAPYMPKDGGHDGGEDEEGEDDKGGDEGS